MSQSINDKSKPKKFINTYKRKVKEQDSPMKNMKSSIPIIPNEQRVV